MWKPTPLVGLLCGPPTMLRSVILAAKWLERVALPAPGVAEVELCEESEVCDGNAGAGLGTGMDVTKATKSIKTITQKDFILCGYLKKGLCSDDCVQ